MNFFDNDEMLLVLQQIFIKKCVLIVDCYVLVCELLCLMLGVLGVMVVYGVGNLVEVICQVKGNCFDIIFFDFVFDDGCDGQ